MKNKFEINLEKVEETTRKFYNCRIKEREAKTELDEANKLLDECIMMINNPKFELQRIK